MWSDVNEQLMTKPELISQTGGIYTMLHQAVFWESSYAVAMLLHHGADVNAPTLQPDPTFELAEGTTPLMLACAVANPDLCRLLICWGADVQIINRDGHGPFDVPTTPSCLAILEDTHLKERAQSMADFAKNLQFEDFERMLSQYVLPLDIKASAQSDYFIISHIARSCKLPLYQWMICRGASARLQTKKQGLLPSQVCATQEPGHLMVAEAEKEERKELQKLRSRI